MRPMNLKIFLVAIVLIAADFVPCASARQAEEPPAERFRRAISDQLAFAERVALLESISKEHPECEWADDALWVLGEWARRQRAPAKMLYYWQYLMSAHPGVALEPYTRSLAVYERSLLPQVRRMLIAEGVAYSAEQPRLLEGKSGGFHVFENASRFNATPMVVWGEIAATYEMAGKPRLSLKAYRKALDRAPATGYWREIYTKRLEALQSKLAATGVGEPGVETPAGADAPITLTTNIDNEQSVPESSETTSESSRTD